MAQLAVTKPKRQKMTAQRFKYLKKMLSGFADHVSPKLKAEVLGISPATYSRLMACNTYEDYLELIRSYHKAKVEATTPEASKPQEGQDSGEDVSVAKHPRDKTTAERQVELTDYLINAVNRNTEAVEKLNTTLEQKKFRKLFR